MAKYYQVNALDPDGEYDWIVGARNAQEATDRVKEFLPEATVHARQLTREEALGHLTKNSIITACIYS